MNDLLRKLIGRDGQHPSRLHTRRGELASPRAYLSLGPSLVGRLFGQRPRPWLAPAAVSFLDRDLRPSDRMLELGGGASTAWFAERVGRLVTVEPDDAWCAHIRETTAGRTNVEILHSSVAHAMEDLALTPTVVLVDHDPAPGDASRGDVASWAAALSPPPRLVVLDDSDKPELAAVFDAFLDRYDVRPFHGFKARPLRLVETTAFVLRGAP